MSGVDVIGDIHGYAGHLRRLLAMLGYDETEGVYRHRQRQRQVVFLGDLIDRGPNQIEVLTIVRRMVEAGTAKIVMGNHDSAVGTPSEGMNAMAQAAIEWTRGRLSAAQRRFLAELPLTRQEDDRLYVHSEASHPARWHYVSGTSDAARSIEATRAHVTFCGHIHMPALYSMSSAA